LTTATLDAHELISRWAKAAQPPPRLTVSEWADRYRMLPEASAARGARWRTSTAPYLRGVMDVLHEPGVQKVALMKAHQTGGSEALNNILGYLMQHDPAPMLLVHPTATAAEAYSKERLADMIRTTPALRDVVQDKRLPGLEGRPESTLTLKMFPGGFLALGGANTPNTFARWSVRLALGDDVDRFPPVIGDEGDPADLLVNRTTSFHDGLSFFVSTPVLRRGRIDTLYTQSDQRRYHVQCPRCDRWDWIAWSDRAHWRVTFDDRDPETARLECACGAQVFERDRAELVAGGQWRPTAEAIERGLVGFHIPAMLSPFVTTADLVSDFLAKRARGRESLRVFFATSAADPMEDHTDRMVPSALMNRREDYGEDVDVPEEACVLTAGVDVQSNRFELLVVGWSPNGERWIVDQAAIPGDPRQPDAWAALEDALRQHYRHAGGAMLPIHAIAIDSGFATERVYDFAMRFPRWVYATKGFAGRRGEPIVGTPGNPKDARVRRRGVRLFPLNVDGAKDEIYETLALPGRGPGAWHFPRRVETIGEEFFAQLCAEHRETRYNKGGVATHAVWVLDRVDNHALDCAVMALAMFRLFRPAMLRDLAEIVRRPVPLEARVEPARAAAAPPPSSSAPPPATIVRPETWIGPRRGWLKR